MCEINGLFCQISIGLPIQQKTGIGVLVMSSNDLEKEVGIPAAAEAAVDDFEPDPTTIPIWFSGRMVSRSALSFFDKIRQKP